MKVIFFICFIFGLWYGLSGITEIFYLVCGVVSSVVVCLIYEILTIKKLSRFGSINIFKLFLYILWLFGQIIQSAFSVMGLIFQSSSKISPTYGYIKMNVSNNLLRAIYANSVTLTPGTMTMQLKKNEFFVHALTKNDFDELCGRNMEVKIIKLQDKLFKSKKWITKID